MSRARIKRRTIAVLRYEARYIKPPHGFSAVTPLPSGSRLLYRWARLPWDTELAMAFRRFYRTR